MSQLQNRLGVLNDITTTKTLLHQIVDPRPDCALDDALHIFADWNACNAMHNPTHMDEAWRTFISQKLF